MTNVRLTLLEGHRQSAENVVGDVESVLLEKTSGGWRIPHNHWSSHHREGGKL